jgi:hypothetical protein
MDSPPQADNHFYSLHLPSAFYSLHHKNGYLKAVAFTVQFVLADLLPLPFF